MLAKLFSRLTYANVMATAALFVALGGSSYAALRVTSKDVPRDALTGADIRDLTGKDVRDNSLTGRDVKNGTLRALDFGAGQLPRGERGLQGPAGAPATRHFAYVRVNTFPAEQEVVYGSGVTGVGNVGGNDSSPGEFDVSFDRSLTNCVGLATSGFGFPRGGELSRDLRASAAVVVNPDGRTNVARVFLTNALGDGTDRTFFITMFC